MGIPARPPALLWPRRVRTTQTRTRVMASTGATSPLANPLAIHIPSLDNTYGALLLGTFFGLMCVLHSVFRSLIVLNRHVYRLYGLSLHQGYQYMRIHWGDLRPLKLYVRTAPYRSARTTWELTFAPR